MIERFAGYPVEHPSIDAALVHVASTAPDTTMIRAFRVTLETTYSHTSRPIIHTRRIAGEDMTQAAACKLALRRERAAVRAVPHLWRETVIVDVTQETTNA